MQHTLFISDLHLCDTRPAITHAFLEFTKTSARKADALYILGDLFEYWPGDDCIESGFQSDALAALHALTQAGVAVYVLHGNRDFLLDTQFELVTGACILPDPMLLSLYGKPVLVSHGDALCTDDTSYQAFRKEVRAAAWQAEFLRQPLSKRLEIIAQLREGSNQAKAEKAMQIMDVNEAVVETLLAQFGYPPLFIHGHTHRPKAHEYSLAGHHCTRWVLGDWYEQGSFLRLSPSGTEASSLG